MSHPRDPYDRSREPQDDDIYGQEPWMLDPYADSYADPYSEQPAGRPEQEQYDQFAPEHLPAEQFTPEQIYAQEPYVPGPETGKIVAQTGYPYEGDYQTGELPPGAFQTGFEPDLAAWPTPEEMRAGEPESEAELTMGGRVAAAAAAAAAAAPRLRRVRRQRGRKLDTTALVALGLIVAMGVALLLIRPHEWEQPKLASESSAPTASTVVCPGKPKNGSSDVAVTNAAGGSGEVSLAGPGAGKGGQADVGSGKVTSAPAKAGSVVVRAGKEVAPGLVAGRSTTKPLAATGCLAPQAEAWFPGVGAGATHNSVLELTNPNSGAATVDISLYDDKGAVAVPEDLRGVAIPGNTTRTFDLLHVIPRKGELSLKTTVVRGQAGVMVRDRAIALETSKSSEDYFPGQSAPAETNLLVGYPNSSASRTLTVVNPGDAQVSAKLRLLTPKNVLTPEGAPEISVPPNGQTQVDVTKLLGKDSADDAYGVEIVATGPVSTAMRSVDGGDVAITTATETISKPTAVVVPAGAAVGKKRVVISGPVEKTTASGTVKVVPVTAKGKALKAKSAKIGPGLGAEIEIPSEAALVQLVPEGVGVNAAVVMSGDGDAVVPFRPLRSEVRTAGVAPGLPLPLKP
ncbi:hypothetical protein J2S40_003021 [Nocardioides luteus]|uniref:Uncharacterized protein n=1 Tax=Nocardioides luteus TaxID=1844 RepID=A0ABQ5SZ58_9ACTN|nr:DUF5719 family protein [Nocardioides luteus]MDR7311963.1 hypothetical protein [Nocardioides luteus]GGR68405.1 hypothetical protein GCM10010197_39840 [Nocardioides luteus]GLJ68206.1 hypothetical protein GCM10017579_22420 [Nocardioides luteus]